MKKLAKILNKKIVNYSSKLYKAYMCALINLYVFAATSNNALAEQADFGNSIFATGTKNLFVDVGKWLLIIAPISGGLLGVYFFIRRQAADEMDQKKWNDRIKTTIISTIGAVLVSSLIILIASYYGKTVTPAIST